MAVSNSSSAVFFVDIVVVLLFCRNLTFELVVDCMRAGLKKKAGGRGGRSPPAGGLGGAERPRICKRTFSPTKSFEKRLRSCGVLIVVIIITVQ